MTPPLAQAASTPYWLSIIATVAAFGYILWRYARTLQAKPHFEPSEILFQERFASGSSQKNILTKIGGARNCLRLVVTKRFLRITSWFPFSLIAPYYDLEHVIPLDSILSLRPSKFLGTVTLLLTFRNTDGEQRALKLLPKNRDAFIQSLGVKLEHEALPRS